MRTPLILAAWSGHSSAVDLLVDRGADVNVKDKVNKSVQKCLYKPFIFLQSAL